VFVCSAFITVPIQTRLNQRAMSEREDLTALMLEAARQQRALERLGMGDVWTARCDAALERSASAARGARFVQHLSQVLGQTLMLSAGIGAVYLGTGSALANEISFGALIALIALSWKVLAPIQMLYTSAYQIAGHMRSGKQVNAFLGLAEERRTGPSRSSRRMFRGALRLEGVAHRYAPMSDPALSGVSMSIEAGELVLVCGRNGVGKSTLLKLLGGLHAPSNGAILIDGIDYRQIAVDELRDSIGYVPQITEFFHGSVEQNFRLVAAGATEAEIMDALDRMSLSQIIENLPEGLQTRLSEEIRRDLPSGTLQAMSVARGLLRDRPLYLLDEPCAGLDGPHEEAIWAHLETLRGRSTVIMVSDRPSHFALADRLIFLDRGRVVVNDTGTEALRKVRALYASMRRN
ncbi:MAG: ABC transporter ATP-binding protein, partial [Pseudomonadota bacterium]